MKARMNARAASVEQQLAAPMQPIQLELGKPLPLAGWRFKSGSTSPAASGRSFVDNREVFRVIGRGAYSSGAWRKTLFLDKGRYEFSGRARVDGMAQATGQGTNGVILRISGERSTKGISTSGQWTTLTYEFDVVGIEDVELICEFRGPMNASGFFDSTSLRLTRKGPPGNDLRVLDPE
jgi:hypothetical protein